MADTPGTVERTARETEPQAVARDPELSAHPGPRQYVLVAIALAVATAIEVAWYYASVPHPLFVALLLFLSFIKFSLVVLWFMHLRFDSPIFRRMFVLGVAWATTVYVIVLTIFGALHALFLVGLIGLGIVVAAIALAVRRRSIRERS